MKNQNNHSPATSHKQDGDTPGSIADQGGGQYPPNDGNRSFLARCRSFSWQNPLLLALIFGILGVITLTLSHADSNSVKRLAPAQAASLTTAQPQFTWASIATNATYEIEISSRVSRGSTPTQIVDTTVTGTSYTPVKPLAAGSYVWRIRGTQPKTTWTSTWSFTTSAAVGPVGGGNGGTGTPPPPPPSATGGITPTPGAINVRSVAYGARGDGTGDDTAAFKKAIAAASTGAKYANGPGGQQQGVVYVPAGTYRLLELPFSSNIRMEVDAGAVLEQAGGLNPGTTAVTLIRWDGAVGAPLKNVSLIGVGSSNTALKTMANPVVSGRSVSNSFTFNVDAAATAGSNRMSGLIIQNTQGFLVENVFSIENDHLPDLTASSTKNIKDYYPTSQKAVLVMRARADSPCGGPYAQPMNGTIANWYNIHGPKGYGPNQVGAGQNISFQHIFTQGGTALRLETDSSEPSRGGTTCPNGKTKFGSEIRGLTATDIEGLNCNRAVSFTPHLQDNYAVTISSVLATNCSQGVIESKSPINHVEGSFNGSSITNIKVVGSGAQQLAQNGTSGAIVGYWTIGKSRQAFARDNGLAWWITYKSPISCQGSFQTASSTIHTATGTTVPACRP